MSDARPQLLDDQPRLDGLADADLVGDEQARPVGADELQHRPILVGHELARDRSAARTGSPSTAPAAVRPVSWACSSAIDVAR